jgi:ABC-type phosphate/phosphonate transport system substrate-binding protein
VGQPSLKLVTKERVAKTPYQRVLASNQVEQSVKDRLREAFNQLNPAELKRKITRLQRQGDLSSPFFVLRLSAEATP